ncbi:hypothetical protein KITKAT_6 [Arthrobacter phage Kitkat]|uniref:Metallothionein n=1 Tax=Arthrobacter phage Kitkat TaxID=1796996 RepID=A0A140G6I6_9CAUD|nr:hypothetical protein BJD77_gp006 [Arthrobacter phage Kitkat]AMM44271.1 hypothetical protein KITKAT_6 [Arthrobacter phage Kitkat]
MRECHACSCHTSPPCSRCEHCQHYDGRGEGCENDCWDCEEHEDA